VLLGRLDAVSTVSTGILNRKRYQMPGTKAIRTRPAVPQEAAEVLTVGKAAVYPRLDEADVLLLLKEQGLPARRVGKE
jgi:hypothetical protein